MALKKALYIGSYSGMSKEKNRPYYVVYLGVEMTDNNGNPIGDGFKPKTLFVEKDEYTDFANCGIGTEILADIHSDYDREKKVEKNVLKRYQF